MASLVEELKKQAIAKRLQEQMEPEYRYDIDPTPQGYTEDWVRDVPAYAGMSAGSAEASGMVVQPFEDKYYDPQTKASFKPEEVEFTPEGKYRVKSWGKRWSDQLKQYPMVKRKAATYTDANIQKTETRPAADLSKPESLRTLTSEVIRMGGKPQEYGLPSAVEAVKLPGEMEKQKGEIEKGKIDRQGDFKTAVQVQKLFGSFGLNYDTRKSYRDNWNATVQQLDPETRTKFIEAGLEALNPKTGQETALMQNAKYLAEKLNVTEEEAVDRLQHLKGKTRQQYVLDVYQQIKANYGGDEKIARAKAEEAEAFYDMVHGKNKEQPKETTPQAGTRLSKSGRPMVKDPNSPTGWSYAQ